MEALVATALFMIIIVIVSGMYIRVLDLQRRAIGAARVQENALYVVETVSREVRVSRITSGDTDCDIQPIPADTGSIDLLHPVNGAVRYRYNVAGGTVERDEGAGFEEITSPEVRFTSFAFCVAGSGPDDRQARVTLLMTVENISPIARNRVPVTLQTTVVSRDLVTDLTN